MLILNIMRTLVVFFYLYSLVLSLKRCYPEKPFLKFYKIRSCYKSTVPVISWKNFNSVKECMKFAREKDGLAFNFSPPELKNQNRKYRNCQVLGCPETGNASTFVFDPFFDYYTAYGDLNATINATCIKSVGLFDIVEEKRNYTEAVKFCQSLEADLADVLTETRTNALATLLKRINGWYKAAYVGLEDTEVEGVFETPMGNVLDCTQFRAWSVGHPRPGRSKEDCVMLDVDRVWRAINCKIKLKSICEFYPSPPEVQLIDFTNENCSKIKNKAKKKQCLANRELLEIYKNSSRIDQCALMNDFD